MTHGKEPLTNKAVSWTNHASVHNTSPKTQGGWPSLVQVTHPIGDQGFDNMSATARNLDGQRVAQPMAK